MTDARVFVHQGQEKALRFLSRMLILEILLLGLVSLAIVLGVTAFVRQWHTSSDGRIALAVGGLLTFSLLFGLALILARVAFLTLVARRVYTYRYEVRGTRLSAKYEGQTVGEIDLSRRISTAPMLSPKINLSYLIDIVVLTDQAERLPIALRRLDPVARELVRLLEQDGDRTQELGGSAEDV